MKRRNKCTNRSPSQIKTDRTFWGTVSSMCTKYCLKRYKKKIENQRFEQNTFQYQITITARTRAIHLLNNRVSRIGPKRIRIRLQIAKNITHTSGEWMCQCDAVRKCNRVNPREREIQEDLKCSRWNEERLRVCNQRRHGRSSTANQNRWTPLFFPTESLLFLSFFFFFANCFWTV